MKLKFVSAALLGALTLSALQAENSVNPLLSKVDLDGEYLEYRDLNGLHKTLDRLPDMFLKSSPALDMGKEDAVLLAKGIRLFMNAMNLKACSATVTSSKEIEPGLFVMKQFAYLGDKVSQPGIFTASGRSNHRIDWQSLPADTRIAIDTTAFPGMLLRNILSEMQKSDIPQFAMIPMFIGQMSSNTGIDIIKLFDSIDRIKILVTGSSLQDAGAVLTISDKNGSITAQLKNILPPLPNSNQVPLPIFPELSTPVNPVLFYGDKEITIASSSKTVEKPAKNISQLPQFRKFAAQLPDAGTGFILVNFEQRIIDSIVAMLPDEDDSKLLLNEILKPVMLLNVTMAAADGMESVCASNLSLPQLAIEFPIAGTLFPAIIKAKQQQQGIQKIQNTNDIKQLGLALSMYTFDRDGDFPAALEVLFSENYCKATDLVCGKCGKSRFIYLAGKLNINKIADAAKYPVLFTKPGCCALDRVNIVFADGHVMSVNIDNYTSAEQVIGELNKLYAYPPETLDALMRAIAENK